MQKLFSLSLMFIAVLTLQGMEENELSVISVSSNNDETVINFNNVFTLLKQEKGQVENKVDIIINSYEGKELLIKNLNEYKTILAKIGSYTKTSETSDGIFKQAETKKQAWMQKLNDNLPNVDSIQKEWERKTMQAHNWEGCGVLNGILGGSGTVLGLAGMIAGESSAEIMLYIGIFFNFSSFCCCLKKMALKGDISIKHENAQRAKRNLLPMIETLRNFDFKKEQN